MKLPDPDLWKTLSPAFDELVALDPPSRARRLDEWRVADPALHAQLGSLLHSARLAEESQFLGAEAAAALKDEGPSLAGRRIGAYVVESLLGQGGSGSVWRARRADGRFEGSVAVKLLHLSLLGRTGALRFEREGAILAKLTHRRIARLLDAGVTAEGQPYLVIELVEGERIDRYCDAGRLNIEQRLDLFMQVLDAVAHAHSHLVIHRDIKPNNILVTADGSVMLLDFGIAKLLLDEPDAAPVTGEAQRALTPEYAAPEQLGAGAVTTATDVYSLGVLLYQLLVGRHPTAESTGTPAEAVQATLHTDPPPLAAALMKPSHGGEPSSDAAQARDTSLLQLRRQLQGDLDNIVSRALRKEPSERYQTVGAMAEDLRRYLAHEPVSARPGSFFYRSAKFVRRHRGAVAAGLMVMLAVTGGLVAATIQAQRAQRERDHAVRQLTYAKSSAEFISFLIEESAEQTFSTTNLLSRAEPLLKRQFADDPSQRAHLELLLANLYANQDDRAMSARLAQSAQRDARQGSDLLLRAEIDCLVAFQLGYDGHLAQARAALDAVIAGVRATAERDGDPATLVQCLQSRSEISYLLGDAPAALADARRSFEVLGHPNALQRTQFVIMRQTLATSLGAVGRSAEAEQQFRAALAEMEAMGRGRTLSASGLHNNLGVVASRAGQTLAASNAFEQAIDIQRLRGGVNPATESNFATQLMELGRSREAMVLVEHAVAEAKARGNARVLGTALSKGALAWCAVDDLAKCGEMLSTARATLTPLLPAGHSSLGVLETSEAQLALARARPKEAGLGLARAVAIFEAAGDKNPNAVRALTLLARTEAQAGQLDAAQAHATQAIAQARQAMAGYPHSAWLGHALVAQGLIQKRRGDIAAARASWTDALAEFHEATGDFAPAAVEARQLLSAS